MTAQEKKSLKIGLGIIAFIAALGFFGHLIGIVEALRHAWPGT